MYRKACGAAKLEAAKRCARSQHRPRNLGAAVAGLLDVMAAWAERRRQRLALSSLDDNLLRDVGLSRADVAHEVEKPFWKG